jgi:hypothetical protein
MRNDKNNSQTKNNFLIAIDMELSLQSIQSRFMSNNYRPRLLVCSDSGMCQSEIIADLLYRLDRLPVHSIDMVALHR